MLEARNIRVGYSRQLILDDVSLSIREGEITTIIGPNGCGKSTLLRALSRLLAPESGTIVLEGQDIHQRTSKDVARRLGLLAQQSENQAGLAVEELVHRGRYPHQAMLQAPTQRDRDAVERAIDLAGVQLLRDMDVDHLSGGQRQRAWIAMVLAQETPLMLLDEPTTYLDVSHQMEVMDVVSRLNAELGRTVVMVLHDINEAANVSDRIIAMRDGAIIADGSPETLLRPEIISALYGVACDIYPHPCPRKSNGFCVPRSERFRASAQTATESTGMRVRDVGTGYGKRVTISSGLTVDIPGGKITAIVGPNACGKSTLLRTVARLQAPIAGTIHLGDESIHRGSHKSFARKLALLSQSSVSPDQFSVRELIAMGRRPHQSMLKRWSAEDERLTDWAIDQCRLADLADRPLSELSGGQRQRVWFAMTLVQDTDVILLDEPTSFLDISAQIEMLDIVARLNREFGKTIAMVLHDLNLAARYADHMIAMRAGAVIASGSPETVMTGHFVREVFGVQAEVLMDPLSGTPLMVPRPMPSQTRRVSAIAHDHV